MSGAAAGAPRILVVEDDEEVRQLIVEVLTGEGFEIFEARDGWQALDAARDHPPALAIVDMMLPGIDGEAVASALKVMEGIPMLLITGSDNPAQRAQRMGAYAYLQKPFKLDALVAAVHDGLTA